MVWVALISLFALLNPPSCFFAGALRLSAGESGRSAVAFSGGGIPALVSAMCVERALDEYVPEWDSSKSTTISTVSGGSAGHAIYSNARAKVSFPDLERGFGMKLEELQKTLDPPRSDAEQIYMLQVNHLIESLGIGSIAKLILALFKYAGNHKNWWSNIMDLMITFPYNITHAVAPGENWIAGFSAIKKDKCPLSLDKNGDMKSLDATAGLIPSTATTRPDGSVAIEAHGAFAGAFSDAQNNVTFQDILGFSTAFWVSNVVDNRVPFWTLQWTLSQLFSSLSGQRAAWFASDGGNVDTTGIVNLLRSKHSRIVAFYSNNKNMTELASPIAYLFGMNGTSDAMNSIEGSALNQVFASELYADTMRNLTSGPYALLRNIDVMKNSFLGIDEAYTLDELMIIASNGPSQREFLSNFDDSAHISAALDVRFPTYFPVALPDLDANVVCLYEHWKVRENRDKIKEVLSS